MRVAMFGYQTWGHRNDVPGFAAGLRELDRWIPRLRGAIRDEDLIILTADHGNEREEDFQVVLPDGTERGATLPGCDRGTDLALLRLSQAAGGSAAQPGSGDARVGNLVVAVGRPATESIQASLGMVIALACAGVYSALRNLPVASGCGFYGECPETADSEDASPASLTVLPRDTAAKLQLR